MTAPYDPTLASPRDQARFLLGDTDAANPLLQDTELDWLLAQQGGSAYRAAEAAARSLAAKYSRLVTTSVGDTSVQLGELAERFRDLAADLARQAAARGGGAPFAGGLSVADVAAREADVDRVAPFFDREVPA